ncbi:hypothetical protein GXP67_15165 [Rhodocytophaga rosea]|uniref:DUF3575 domain-containing protein n=1 Tax=Rhodocytophaga rosea TaxID=2704465 RepID=A0A6C0GJP1_9BACT|nr:hypothetical protein [Rhodocytophaga rosea]QHT67882.1 hypothetical protein GXP67_15165 [Rhodocytophaga rosea]
MQLFYKKGVLCWQLVLLLSVITRIGWTQPKTPYVQLGTQFPLQYTAGFEYQFHPRFSAAVQVGLLAKPYDKYLLYCMEVAGLSKNLSHIIEKSFEKAYMGSIGINYHFNQKYYAGVYGLASRMYGKGPLLELANVYYKGKFPANVDPALLAIAEGLQMNWESDLICAGLLAGRRFLFPNSKFEFRAEIGFTKIMGSQSRYSVGYSIIDDSVLAQNLYTRMNDEFKKSYWKYGYVPSLNLYLVYRLK